MLLHVFKLLPLLGWYTGMLISYHLDFTKSQLAMVFNLSELHKAHVLHHWRLVGIPMISQEVKYADTRTVANCHLCNHPFRNLYEIKENRDEEKVVTRKHQIEADRVIGGIRSKAAVTMLRDAFLSTALYVCLACAAPVLGARYQRRETTENIQTRTSKHSDATAISLTVALAGVVRVVIPGSEAILAGSFKMGLKCTWRQPNPSGMWCANARRW